MLCNLLIVCKHSAVDEIARLNSGHNGWSNTGAIDKVWLSVVRAEMDQDDVANCYHHTIPLQFPS